MDVTRTHLHSLPKVDLHVHLDGSLRPQTLVELAAEYGRDLPTTDASELSEHLRPQDGQSLEDYLRRFDLLVSVMQHEAAIERVAFELAEDNARENVRYLEVRFCPVRHTLEGLAPAASVEAALRGLARAEELYGISTAIIICGVRNFSPQTSRDLAELAVAFKKRGVVAFDLAGAELNHPAKKHRNAFYTVLNHNMATTLHAGEAYGPESIHQALHYCGANRIGHGTRLIEDPDLLEYVRDFSIPLEVCLTSNVQTGAVESLARHPLRAYFDAGCVVTLATDNRLISGTTVTEEYWRAHRHLGFTWDELLAVTRMGFRSAFLPLPEKRRLLRQVDDEIGRIGQVPE